MHWQLLQIATSGPPNHQYDYELGQGSVKKYTAYSNKTGITVNQGHSLEDEQHCDSSDAENGWNDGFFEEAVTFLTNQINQFAEEREWKHFHTPRNLQLAVLGEIGELAELFQFKGDDKNQSMSVGERVIVGQELADVTIYLLHLAEACSVTYMLIAIR